MTTFDKIARRKLSLLDLASELSNVSRACKVMGYSRQQFYEIRRNFQAYGAEGLLHRMPGARGPHPNRVAQEIETAILDHALGHPCHGSTPGVAADGNGSMRVVAPDALAGGGAIGIGIDDIVRRAAAQLRVIDHVAGGIVAPGLTEGGVLAVTAEASSLKVV